MYGYDFVLTPFFGASFAQTAVVLAILLKTKDKKLRSLSIPSAISGLFGVTEPAIYGITLPKKIPFIISCIGGAAGGAVLGAAGAKVYVLGGLGIFGFPSFINTANNSITDLIWALIGVAVASIVGFVLTLILYKDDKPDNAGNITSKVQSGSFSINNEILKSPLKGEVKDLSEAEDQAFASGTLGSGVVIRPVEGKVYSPVDGMIETFFPTSHAIGIQSDARAQILIHVGRDTVKLEGKHFTPKVKEGDRVTKGQLLLEFDLEAIKAEGYSITTPILVTNKEDYSDIIFETGKNVDQQDDIITLIK